MNPLANKDFSTPSKWLKNRSKNYFAIPSFYDSHLHLLGLGKYCSNNNLSSISSLEEFEDKICNLIEADLEIQQKNKQSNILKLNLNSEQAIKNSNNFANLGYSIIEGFGLKKIFTSDIAKIDEILKKQRPDLANFYFVIEDGHQLLVHGPILKAYLKTVLNPNNLNSKNDTCLFNDSNRADFDSYLKNQKSKRTESNLIKHLLTAQNILLKSGITHCRDLTSDLDQIMALKNLENLNQYNVFTETYFSDFFGDDLETLINNSLVAKSELLSSKVIAHKGIKIFVDGTFSQATIDTQCYHKHSNLNLKSNPNNKYSIKDLVHFLESASKHNLEIAFHTIGDGAVEKVIEAFNIVKFRFKTKLHLEHCELVNTNTFNHLSNLETDLRAKIKFHFQPSHYVLDKKHLAELQKFDSSIRVFPWYELKKLGYGVFFGSDAPVTSPGLDYIKNIDFFSFFKSELESQAFWSMFSYPEYKLFPNTYTLFNNLKPNSIFINGSKEKL
jgi:predicted amidohydrolase YtcJ